MSEPTKDVRENKPSASSFEIFAECPGMFQLKQALPPDALVRLDTDDDAAAFGTAVHLARQTENVMELTDAQADVYRAGLEVEREILAAWCQQVGIYQYHEGPREQRLWLHDENLNAVASAQLDVQYISDDPPGHIAIIDWKALTCPHLTGAQRNWQLKVQVCCLWEEHDDIQDIFAAFCKPGVYKSKKDMVLYTPDNIRHARFTIDNAIWAAQQPYAPRRPGKHCTYCPCNAACPEAAAWAMLPMVQAKRALPDAEKIEDAVAALTPLDLCALFARKSMIEKILKLTYERLKGLPDETLADLGLEKTKGRALDPIANIPGAVQYLRGRGWTEEEIFGCMREDAFSKEKLAKQIALMESVAETWAAKRIPEEFAPFITEKRADPGLKMIK